MKGSGNALKIIEKCAKVTYNVMFIAHDSLL